MTDQIRSPFFSIITPTFNAAEHIHKCMASISAQVFRDFEHIVIDGGSTDKTVRIVQQLQPVGINSRLMIEKDRGIYDAMNKGITAARGEWLYFLGSDDTFFDVETLLSVHRKIGELEASLVYGNVFFEAWQRLYDGFFNVEKILKRNLCHQAIFYHRSIFQLKGIFDLRYKLLADYAFNLKCWLDGKTQSAYVPITIATYAKGGLSSLNEDEQFKTDYPDIICKSILQGNCSLPAKINLLSKGYRKILMRGYLSFLFRQFFEQGHWFVKISSLLWMLVSLPYYAIRDAVGRNW